jgi:hypothetical protein
VGPKVSADTLAVGKKDGGGMYFYTFGYCNGTGAGTKSSKAIAAATWYDVEIFATPHDSTSVTVTYKVDGEYLKDFTTNLVIRDRLTISSATEMQMFAGVKLGAGTNNDTLSLDLWLGKQRVF